MNTYVVFDLEWNQSASGKEDSVGEMPFEIIEIGAVRLDEDRKVIDSFSRVVRPVVYRTLHFKVTEVVNIGADELRRRGEPFRDVAEDFIRWCYAIDESGQAQDRPTFCTWGDMDLEQLQRNMVYHGIRLPFTSPLLYYDVQKLYSLDLSGRKGAPCPLDKAVETLGIPATQGFHRALADAEYTAQVFARLDLSKVSPYLSVDYYRLPASREEEVYLVFPDYSKYVSSAFSSREELMADRTVTDVLCYRCRRMLRKRVRWFSANQKQYHCIAYCPEHGFVKGKIRIKHTADERVFAVKTIKMVSEEVAASYSIRRDEIARLRNIKRRTRRKNRQETL